MKPWVLRKIDDLLSITSILKRTGSGNLFLADNGQYISSSGGVSAVTEFLATRNGQIFEIDVAAGFVYIINSSAYENIKVQLNNPVFGATITIKNSNAEKQIKIINEIDGFAEFELNAHNAITICYVSADTGWVILEDHLISYEEKHKITVEVQQAADASILHEEKRESFLINEKDKRKFFECDGTFTIYLPNATTMPTGFNCYIKNNGTGLITLEPSVYGQRIDVEQFKEISTNECLHLICASEKYVTSHTASWIAP